MKFLTLTVLFTLLTTSLSAQSIFENALGVRLGDNNGFGGAISYQKYIAEPHRSEFNLGWQNANGVEALKGVALYQWVNNLQGALNWYVGSGGGVGFFDTGEDDGIFVVAAGNFGIEYTFFDVPIMLSLDARTEISFDDAYASDDLNWDTGLGLRYQF